ncbi:hypothetical protein JTB14_007136 [Gonioctena quinquepunctata]|nr:hypothetical protein JTB14_007136 [Gonioctena quinquepunctata]
MITELKEEVEFLKEINIEMTKLLSKDKFAFDGGNAMNNLYVESSELNTSKELVVDKQNKLHKIYVNIPTQSTKTITWPSFQNSHSAYQHKNRNLAVVLGTTSDGTAADSTRASRRLWLYVGTCPMKVPTLFYVSGLNLISRKNLHNTHSTLSS